MSSPELVTKTTTEMFTDYSIESEHSHPNKALEKFLSRYSRSYSGTTQKVVIKISTVFPA